MSIDQFIEIVMTKLKNKVGIGEEEWTGGDLVLTGLKPPLGEKFDKKKKYMIRVPIEFKTDPEEHRTKLRQAFLKKGKAGVRAYLKDYVSPADLDKAMSVL